MGYNPYYVRRPPTLDLVGPIVAMREILLVEDSDNDAALVRRALDFLSVANPVRCFSNGEEAMQHLDKVIQITAIATPPPSIIFLDLLLPRMSGLQILKNMTNQPAFEKTLRIVLTNLSDIDTIKRAYSLGARAYLIKPVQPDDLRELIENFPGHWAFNVEMFSQQTRRGSRVPSK